MFVNSKNELSARVNCPPEPVGLSSGTRASAAVLVPRVASDLSPPGSRLSGRLLQNISKQILQSHAIEISIQFKCTGQLVFKQTMLHIFLTTSKRSFGNEENRPSSIIFTSLAL